MSYAATLHAALRGYGSDMALPACGAHAAMNPKTKECLCQPGFESDDPSKGCTPINVATPCLWTGQVRSSIDKQCECPPGMSVDPRPEGSTCIRMKWFPDCLDAKGVRVPGCFMGYPTSTLLPALAVGVVLGGVLAFAINAVRS